MESRWWFIIVQESPRFHPRRGQYQICRHCPDATIRNGMLTPVCVADLINPQQQGREVHAELRRSIYGHLGEV